MILEESLSQKKETRVRLKVCQKERFMGHVKVTWFTWRDVGNSTHFTGERGVLQSVDRRAACAEPSEGRATLKKKRRWKGVFFFIFSPP